MYPLRIFYEKRFIPMYFSATAILVVGIDEEVPEAEQDYISELQEALKISDKRAQELIDEVFGAEEEEEEEEKAKAKAKR
ncbi:MAG: hypothetical protein ACYTXA_18955 [Nostoc sp.]